MVPNRSEKYRVWATYKTAAKAARWQFYLSGGLIVHFCLEESLGDCAKYSEDGGDGDLVRFSNRAKSVGKCLHDWIVMASSFYQIAAEKFFSSQSQSNKTE